MTEKPDQALGKVRTLSVHDALLEAVTHHRAGRMSDAEELYRTILKTQPKNADANHNLGAIAVASGALDAALPFFEAAQHANPAIDQFWLSHADALVRLGRQADGITLLARAREWGLDALGLKAVARRLAKGDLPPQGNQASAAEETLQRAVVLSEMGRYQASCAAAEKAVTLNPRSAKTRALYGEVLHRLGRFGEAVAAYDTALVLEPMLVATHGNRILALMELERHDEALSACHTALNYDPGLVVAWRTLSTLAVQADDARALIHLAEQARQKQPEAPGPVLACTALAVQNHDYSAARDLAAPWVLHGRDPNPPDAVALELGWYWCQGAYLTGRWDGLVEVLDRFLMLYHPFAGRQDVHNDLGLMDYTRRLVAWHVQAGTTAGTLETTLSVIGDSHSLSLAHVPVCVDGRRGRIESFYVRGAKVHDLINERTPQYWSGVIAALQRSHPDCPILLCFGQLDCRGDAGLIRAWQSGYISDLDEEIARLVVVYVEKVAKAARTWSRRLLVMGVPAPNLDWSTLSPGDRRLMIRIVQRFNLALSDACAARAVPFVDVYSVTRNAEGVSNKRWHSDPYHLVPSCIQSIFPDGDETAYIDHSMRYKVGGSSLRVLFVHQNFPGQFKYLAPELARSGATVKALTLKEGVQMEGVEVLTYSLEHESTAGIHRLARDHEAKVIRGESCARAAAALRRTGFVPDVIYAHSGWGEALFLKDVFPESKLIGYFEFYYRPTGLDLGFDPEFPSGPEEAWRVRVKNTANLLTLDACDRGISPTEWQRNSYPAPWRDRIEVLHEGIDTDRARPDPTSWMRLGEETFSRDDEVITFVVRNLEPYRGFHVFMRALPGILARRPNARVLVVGGSQVSYGTPPPCGRTWREAMIEEVGHHIDQQRVIFVDTVPYESFLRILQVSAVHVYLTYPFVLSWSLLEAMAVECAVVASRTGPAEEVIDDGENGLLVDFFDRNSLIESVSRLLSDRSERRRLGAAARQTVLERFDLAGQCLPRQVSLLQDLATS